MTSNRPDSRSIYGSNDQSSSSPNSYYFEVTGEESITERLALLPKIKAAPDFEQKLAARMSLEIEEETARRNRSMLKKSKNVSIPGPFLYFSK